MKNNIIFSIAVVFIYTVAGYLSYAPAVRFYLHDWILVTTDLRDYFLTSVKVSMLSAFVSLIVTITFQKLQMLDLRIIRLHVCFFIMSAAFFVVSLCLFRPLNEMDDKVAVAFSVNNISLIPYYLSSFFLSLFICILMRKKW